MAIILRAFGGIVAAMLVAFVLLIAVEFFSSVVHPTPPDFQGTMEEMCQHVERYPHWVLAVVVPAWAGTALASTWIAGRLGGRGCALVIGVLLSAGLVFNVSMLPYPLWFKIVSLIAIPCATIFGVKLTGRLRSAIV